MLHGITCYGITLLVLPASRYLPCAACHAPLAARCPLPVTRCAPPVTCCMSYAAGRALSASTVLRAVTPAKFSLAEHSPLFFFPQAHFSHAHSFSLPITPTSIRSLAPHAHSFSPPSHSLAPPRTLFFFPSHSLTMASITCITAISTAITVTKVTTTRGDCDNNCDRRNKIRHSSHSHCHQLTVVVTKSQFRDPPPPCRHSPPHPAVAVSLVSAGFVTVNAGFVTTSAAKMTPRVTSTAETVIDPAENRETAGKTSSQTHARRAEEWIEPERWIGLERWIEPRKVDRTGKMPMNRIYCDESDNNTR